MPGRDGEPSLRKLRDALAVRVEVVSLRQAAREVGMSPTGLHKFLSGASPYSATRRKLERWYVREAAARWGHISVAEALAALRVLLQDLAPASRRTAAETILAALDDAYRDAARRGPSWLPELRERLARGVEL